MQENNHKVPKIFRENDTIRRIAEIFTAPRAPSGYQCRKLQVRRTDSKVLRTVETDEWTDRQTNKHAGRQKFMLRHTNRSTRAGGLRYQIAVSVKRMHGENQVTFLSPTCVSYIDVQEPGVRNALAS